MKRKFFLITLIWLLTIGIALAQLVPHPIAVKITSNLPISEGIEVKITNLATSEQKTFLTNNYGEIMTDAQIFKDFRESDVLEAVITACSVSPSCTQEKKLGVGVFFEFDLTEIICLPCPECKICEICEICEICQEPIDCPVCPDLTVSIVITFIVTLIVSIGGGLKIYKNKFGKATFLHRHKGIRGYHSPNVRHKKIKYRHRLWKDDPIGCMNDVRKINES